MKSSLDRERAKQWPTLPRSLHELGLALYEYAPLQEMFRCMIDAEDGNRILIFTSDALLGALQQSQELYMDGTFSVVPRVPSIAQLYTVHVRHMDTEG